MLLKNKNILLSFILACAALCAFPFTVYAHPTAAEHDKELMSVLFEEGYSKYQSTDIKNAVNALEKASQLTVDQFGGKSEESFIQLRQYGSLSFLWSFEDDVDYSVDVDDEKTKINANTHRKYTHQGWDIEKHGIGTKNASKFWNKRRKILLNTANTVFDFGPFSTSLAYDPKCDSFCAIVYYVHILGDYDEADNYKKLGLLIPLAGHDGTDKNDIICELKNSIEVLFADQKSTQEYTSLMKDLDSIQKKAGKLVRSVGGVNTDQEFNDYHQYADETLEALQKYVPKLLKNEKFFREVFYPGIGTD